MAKKENAQNGDREKTRSYISQSDIPSVTLDEAIRIPAAIGENYGYKPATPLHVAKAMDVQPATGHFMRKPLESKAIHQPGRGNAIPR